jgi:hypothetical protein
MKQNPCPVVGEVAKPTRIGLDELDGAVEALGTGVADSVLAEVEQSFLMSPEHLDDLFDRLQATSHRVVRPQEGVSKKQWSRKGSGLAFCLTHISMQS